MSWRDRGLLVRAWLLLCLAEPGLQAAGFRRMQAVVAPGAGPSTDRQDLAEAQHIARLVLAAANRNPFRPNCLARSLVLCRLLRLRGLAAELRIGVAAPGGTFSAHAWVEHSGIALAEPGTTSERYASFDDLALHVKHPGL